jgi:hypothetical protein
MKRRIMDGLSRERVGLVPERATEERGECREEADMRIWIIGGILVLLIMCLFLYALIRSAAIADRDLERMSKINENQKEDVLEDG